MNQELINEYWKQEKITLDEFDRMSDEEQNNYIDKTTYGLNLNKTQEDKMATLMEAAKSYEGKETKNIADLPKVTTVLELVEKIGLDKDNKEYTYQVITIDGLDYRVPASVLKSLKAILEDNPVLKEFKVKKTGQGMDTEYTVIPLS